MYIPCWQIKRHIEELTWVVSKGYEVRHIKEKRFHPDRVKDAVYLLKRFRKLAEEC